MGMITFTMIGILHVAVVRIEERWGSTMWPLFVVSGVALVVVSLTVEDATQSALLGVNGFLFAWSGPELRKLGQRARKG